ncbi:hypothetical protein IMSAGC003_00580 [Lachnospiraceae bacterium]|nr:hypothetical protein IMSAGC003_00580 [Lachnospiraceae bacterium]
MPYKKQIIFGICHAIVLIMIFLSGCGKEKEEGVDEKAFGVDFTQTQAIPRPEQVVCGRECVWAVTAVKGDCIYRLEYASGEAAAVEIPWQQEKEESLINIAQRDGTLYAQVYLPEETVFEIRKYVGGTWLKVTAFEAVDEEWQNLGSGLYVDSEEKVYLAGRGKVTRFGEEGKPEQEYRLGGDARFFLENEEGVVECVAVTKKGIALYCLQEDQAEKQWDLEAYTLRPVGLTGSDEGLLCLATEEELLFVDKGSGRLLARSDLTACGVSSVLAGTYDPQEESLRLYGKESGGNLCYSLLSHRDNFGEQRAELVYGTMRYMGVTEEVQAAIMEFNRTNEDYYIKIRNYNTMRGPEDQEWNWWDDLLRLQADMAGGNAPDLIEMAGLGRYKSYAGNGYLEDLTPYLEQSPYGDDLIWNVLNGFKVNGGLYLMTPHFAVSGVVINPEYAGMAEQWNTGALYEMIEINQWEKSLYIGSRNPSYLLEYLMRGMLNDFVDWEKREASFETEEFLKILALCRESGKWAGTDLPSGEYRELQEGLLVGEAYLYSYSAYLNYVDVFGRQCRVYGFPNAAGQVYGVHMQSDSCAIYAGSRHKEGAWAYIESLLGETNQMGSGYEFPICGSWLKALEKTERKDVIIVNHLEEQLTEAQIQMINDVIYQGEFVYMEVDSYIRSILQEEAAAYFAGDKTAEETARVIQSKVQLILEE